MKSRTGTFALVAALLVACAGPSGVDELKVSNVWARPTPAQSDVAAVYMSIVSPVADELVEVSTDRAESTSLHVTSGAKVDDGAGHENHGAAGTESTMEAVDLVLEPNSRVDLVPGGRHLMLEGLVEPLVEGDTFELILTFLEAGEVRLVVEVATNDPNG
ncbi:MAG: copper chaperone PCu(A)C [Actinobacteria bacterium]|nr:copper chaperone PCu(A)C [Actinomycetota bacterium]